MANTNTYRFVGPQNPMDSMGSIDLTKLTDGEQTVVGQNGTAVLTDEQAADLRASGAKLHKLSDEEVQKLEEKQSKGTLDILKRRGADQTHPEEVLAAREQVERRAEEQESASKKQSGGQQQQTSASGGNQGGNKPPANS